MIDFIRTTIENWSVASSVIVALIGGLVSLGGFLIYMMKTGPVERRATEAATRKSNADVDQVSFDRLVRTVEILGDRLDAAEKDVETAQNTANAAERRVRTLHRKYADLERVFDAVWRWMNNVVTDWSTIRLHTDPPPLPREVLNHQWPEEDERMDP